MASLSSRLKHKINIYINCVIFIIAVAIGAPLHQFVFRNNAALLQHSYFQVQH